MPSSPEDQSRSCRRHLPSHIRQDALAYSIDPAEGRAAEGDGAVKAHRMIPTPLDGEAAAHGVLMLSGPPPSLNHVFVNVAKVGRVRSALYRGWQTLAHLELRKHGPWHVPGKVRVEIQVARKGTRADIDNLIKPTLDLLVSAGRIADDRNVIDVRAFFTDEPGAYVGTRVEIWATQ